jgi:hypothetical protein
MELTGCHLRSGGGGGGGGGPPPPPGQVTQAERGRSALLERFHRRVQQDPSQVAMVIGPRAVAGPRGRGHAAILAPI